MNPAADGTRDSVAKALPTSRRRWWVTAIGSVCIGLTVWLAAELIHLEGSISRAAVLLKQRRDIEAERELEKYLRFHNTNPQANLMWAQAVVSGNSRSPRKAAELAVQRLRLIPDNSEFGGEARMREGRLALLILHQPTLAENLLARSTELNPKLLDSHYLLWKLFDMTERFQMSEPYFWNCFDLTPELQKPERLREWYVSQFSPGAANADLDRYMGFLEANDLPGDETDIRRLEEFYSSEPDSPMVVAAMGQWYFRNHQRTEALSVLKGIQRDKESTQSPFYLATIIAVLLDLGKMEEARSFFLLWPGNDRGHLYWSTSGRMFDLVDRDDNAAADAYDKAIALWPGPVEWPTMHRKSQCLSRLGRKEAAEATRTEARRIELLMEAEVHQRLRNAMVNLDSPETAQQMIDFYDAIHREREANCWREVLQRLRAK